MKKTLAASTFVLLMAVVGPARAAEAPLIAADDLDKPAVLVASGDDAHLVDSVSSGPLAATLGTSVLLVPQARMDANTYGYLSGDQHVQVVYLIGGPAAVSTAVEDRIKSYGIKVYRIAGEDRYETSRRVAEVNDQVWDVLSTDVTDDRL